MSCTRGGFFQKDTIDYSTPFTGSNVAAPARTGEPQKTTNFARQVADPPGENGSDMQLIYMV